MRAGRLRWWIDVERPTVGRDAVGGELKSWSALASGWARPVFGQTREFERLERQLFDADVAFEVRHIPDVDATCRVLSGGRTYEVLGYQPDATFSEGTIYAKESK